MDAEVAVVDSEAAGQPCPGSACAARTIFHSHAGRFAETVEAPGPEGSTAAGGAGGAGHAFARSAYEDAALALSGAEC